MSYYSPYFPSIIANVPTDNPWLLSQMTYNSMPANGPSANIDQIFQDASQFLGQGNLAPKAAPSAASTSQQPGPIDYGGGNSAPTTSSPQGPSNAYGALTAGGVTGLNAFSALSGPFGGIGVGPVTTSPFSLMSTLGQLSQTPQTTALTGQMAEGQTLSDLGFGQNAIGLEAAPGQLSIYGDAPQQSMTAQLMSGILSTLGIAPQATFAQQAMPADLQMAMQQGMLSPVGPNSPVGTMNAGRGAETLGTIGGSFGNSTYSGNSTFSGATMSPAALSAALSALGAALGFGTGRGDQPDPSNDTSGPAGPGTSGPTGPGSSSSGVPGAADNSPNAPTAPDAPTAPSEGGTAGAPGAGGATGGGSDAATAHMGMRIPGRGEKTYKVLGGETIMNREATKAFAPYLDAMNTIRDEHSDNASTLRRLINKAVLHLAG